MALDELTERFEELVAAGTVPANAVSALRSRLEQAQAQVAAGNEGAARRQLLQFVARTRSSLRDTAAQRELVALAEHLITELERKASA